MAETSEDNCNNIKDKEIIIVGGGLVGSLEALYWAKKNCRVDVYEYREDPRQQKYVSGYSINLALSERGRAALRAVGAEDAIVERGIPMHSRMIHSHSGIRTPQRYGQEHQYILSIDRRGLNEHLISLVDTDPHVTYHFNHKFVSGDFDKGSVTFDDKENGAVERSGDLIIGCDGAFSAVRRTLLKKVLMDYSQTYITHGYKEIEMLPNKDGDYAMELNYLHIWPRNTFMMIALPNQNKTFTLTLFMPFAYFDSVKTDEEILSFFEREFPDSIPLIGKEKLISDFKNNPSSPMICIKCKPYHYKDKVVIMGDAAHALVPFYGQGMNCGFEDCLVLHDIMEKHKYDFSPALAEYTIFRNPDAEAIVDLAMYNYLEMRAHVNSKLYLVRKKFDDFLHWIAPNIWIPRYTMTTFSRIRYHKVIERSKKQDDIVTVMMPTCGLLLMGCAVFTVKYSFEKGIYSIVQSFLCNNLSNFDFVTKLIPQR